MKRHYSYLLLKPDGIRFLNDICQGIEQQYESVRYYAINDFRGLIKKLYHKHYEEKGDEFSKLFNSLLYGINEVFGNESVLILVGDSRRPYEELVQSVFDNKIEIRNKYINNRVGLVTDYGNERRYLKILSESGDETRQRIMNSIGSYRINNMDIIHCPDPAIATTLDELQILLNEGVIDDKNLITHDMIQRMRKYQTVNFQRDMREEGYIGEIKPDISGWIKSSISNDADECRF